MAVTVFELRARLRGELVLQEHVRDVALLIGILPEAIRPEREATEAVGQLVLDAGYDAFPGRRPVVPHKSACLHVRSVAAEERVELVEGRDARATVTDQEKVA